MTVYKKCRSKFLIQKLYSFYPGKSLREPPKPLDSGLICPKKVLMSQQILVNVFLIKKPKNMADSKMFFEAKNYYQ